MLLKATTSIDECYQHEALTTGDGEKLLLKTKGYEIERIWRQRDPEHRMVSSANSFKETHDDNNLTRYVFNCDGR